MGFSVSYRYLNKKNISEMSFKVKLEVRHFVFIVVLGLS